VEVEGKHLIVVMLLLGAATAVRANPYVYELVHVLVVTNYTDYTLKITK
jgi:hypothetical protein